MHPGLHTVVAAIHRVREITLLRILEKKVTEVPHLGR